MQVEALGTTVHVEQYGQGPGNVLLLHGWGLTLDIWEPVAGPLSARTRVTALDFPGHGQSGRPPEPWGAESYARMVAEVIEALGIAGCDIIGHSHGGRIALTLAADYPALVGKLALTGAAGLRAEPSGGQSRRTQTYKRLRRAAQAMERARIFGGVPARLQERLIQRYGSADYRALDPEMRRTFVQVVNFDIAPRLPQVKAPTLLLWGSADTETPLWMGRRMESLIPDAGLVVFEGGGHYAFLDHLADFLRIVSHFFFEGDA